MLKSLTIRKRLLMMLVLATVMLIVTRIDSALRTKGLLDEATSLAENRVVDVQLLLKMQNELPPGSRRRPPAGPRGHEAARRGGR